MMWSDGPLDAEYFDLLPRSTVWDMGGVDTGAYEDAARIQANAANRAADLQWQMFQQARTDMAPWVGLGQKAVPQIGGILGLPGYDKVDPTATLKATPGYDWLQGQGVQALDRSAAAKGMTMSGPQAKALTNYGQNLGLTYAWNPYMSALTGASGSGERATGMTGQWGMATGQEMGTDYMAAANAQAQALIQQANAQAAQSGGFFEDIMGGLGLVGGLALSPLTGGTSLIGSGMSAVKNWAGGGGGSGPSLVGVSNAYGGGGGFPMYAEGGFALPNKPIIVGEKGPEVFVPNAPGTVVPNKAVTGSEFNAFAPWRS